MESTLITGLPLLSSPSKSGSLYPSHFAGARRPASVSFSRGVGCIVPRPSGGGAGVISPFSAAAAGGLGETAESGSEAILLSIQGMMCDGCASSVKRILESQPEVTSATVEFKEATAMVWTTPEVKVTEDWQKQCGEKLASHLGTCGFESRLKGDKGEAKQSQFQISMMPPLKFTGREHLKAPHKFFKFVSSPL